MNCESYAPIDNYCAGSKKKCEEDCRHVWCPPVTPSPPATPIPNNQQNCFQNPLKCMPQRTFQVKLIMYKL